MASTDVLTDTLLNSSSSESAINTSKRKRDESVDGGKYTNGTQDSEDLATSAESQEDFIRDLLDVLKLEDPPTSVLSRPIPDTTSKLEPQHKRQKSDDNQGLQPTILTRFISKEYMSVDDVLKDIDVLVADIKEELRPRTVDTRTQYIADTDKILKVTAFKERAYDLVSREKAARSLKKSGNSATAIKPSLTDKKLVLTLYGNAPGPKQLFSSLQQYTQIDGQRIKPPVRESGLPNGISITQIIPPQVSGVLVGDNSRVKTLGELFLTPGNLPAIPPPKPSKIGTTRSNTVGWYQPAPKDLSPRAPGYLTQNIVAGQWLDYSKPNVTQDARRRHRDRAMSLTGTKTAPVEQDNAETEAAKLDALFRSAYSGFAPTKDHSAAIVSEGHVNRIWWQKSGEKAYDRFLADFDGQPTSITSDNDVAATLEVLDITKLEELAEFDPDTIDPSLVPLGEVVKKSAEERDTEEVLADISELLETLNSYQRIRHMSLNSARPSGVLLATDNSTSGTPSKPSESEQITYETLKTSLKLMIETLPPYAVAKLDPDRLADLCISTKIEVAQEEYKGVMEEDEASARARAALAVAASRAPATASLQRSGSSNQIYSNQYSSQQGSTNQLYRQNATHTPVRPTSNNYQRPPATISAPYQARQAAVPSPAYRPTYGTPAYPQQSQQNVRQTQMQYQGSAPYTASNQQYQQPNNAAPYMRPQSQNQGYSQSSQGAPQHGVNGSYGRPSYPQQNQPLQNGMNYQYNTNNIPRQASPQKMYSPQPTPSQPRQYGTPTPTPPHGPSRPPSYLQNPLPQNHMGGAPSQTSQPAYQRQQSGSHMNYSTFMTSAEQTNLLERQRAQLAQQQGMQQQARTAAQAAMGSPSPATNGAYLVPTGQ